MLTSDLIVGQVQAELDQMRDLYVERAPKKVLEIGVYYGGTLREWLTHAASNGTVVAVDPDHKNPELYEGWTRELTRLVVAHGRTSEVTDLIKFHAPYDWVFIDGDHSEAGVRFDISFTLPLVRKGGLMLIHDILPDHIPPRVCFEELAENHETWTIVAEPDDDYPDNCGHGIGIIQC